MQIMPGILSGELQRRSMLPEFFLLFLSFSAWVCSFVEYPLPDAEMRVEITRSISSTVKPVIILPKVKEAGNSIMNKEIVNANAVSKLITFYKTN